VVATPEKAWSQRLNQLQRGLWSIFFIAFFIDLALLTLVFSDDSNDGKFFTKQSKTKAKGISNASVWGFNYCYLCSSRVLVTWIFGADALNALSTNVWFNIIFFVLLVVFAASFLGAFEIMLPNSLGK
jgi:thiol:disulfide interchange protein DsbD